MPGDVVWWVSAVLMGVAVVLTITSGLEFARDAVKQRRAARAVHVRAGSPSMLVALRSAQYLS